MPLSKFSKFYEDEGDSCNCLPLAETSVKNRRGGFLRVIPLFSGDTVISGGFLYYKKACSSRWLINREIEVL
jgi:hypothetical protein